MEVWTLRGHAQAMERCRRPRFPWMIYAATIASAVPIGAILATSNPMPEGACSGIGFGCSLYGWDAVGFAYLIFGVPFAVTFAVILGVLSLPSIRRPWLTSAVATIGFALPWLAVAVLLS